MRILILGGDGYLGWPTAMRFSARGHEVFIVDNFSRRRWHHEHSTDSLTPISSLGERIEAWREVTGRNIQAMIGNIDDGEFLDQVVADVLPEAVVHYGEQPSRAVLDDLPPPRGQHAADERDRHAQPAVLAARPRARLPPGQARHDGRVRHAQHRHRRGLHRDRAQGPQGHAALPEAAGLDLPPLQGPRLAQHPLRVPRSGACARPTSTRASCTASRPTRRRWTTASARASTTTRSSAPRSTASACRP